MALYTVPPVYAAFIWWFSTGAVLLLVGCARDLVPLQVAVAAFLVAGSLCGLALSAGDASIGGAYIAFTSTILLWGAQEIAFLSGWVTGPRPQPCPVGVTGSKRLGLALAAILYHELALLASGVAIVALTWNGANQIAIWTFAALWALRQSAKINLFLGVPVTNAELMPQPVQFLKTFFARRPVSAFFPISVTLATAALVVLLQRIAEVAATPFDVVGLALVSTLFALGVVEHWFMLLPLPAITLWGWGMRSGFPPEDATMKREPDAKASDAPPNLVVLASVRADAAPSRPTQAACARQRLEDQFRRSFCEQNPRDRLTTGLNISEAPAVTFNGRSS
jgi:putative photosynthetic complex assembly protein 2